VGRGDEDGAIDQPDSEVRAILGSVDLDPKIP
jgi:hypothetical protein